MEPALAQLQGRRNLNAKLEQALAQGEEERQPWIEQIQRDLEEAISVGSEVLRETTDELALKTAQAEGLENSVATLTKSVGELKKLARQQAGQLADGQRQVRFFKGIVFAIGAIVVLGMIVLSVFLIQRG